MHDDLYISFDIICSIYEECVLTVVKLVINQDEYLKSRLMSNDCQLLCGLIDFMCSQDTIANTDQPVLHYRQFLAASDVVRYLAKHVQQMCEQSGDLASILQGRQCTKNSNQVSLLLRYRPVLTRVLSTVIKFMMGNINYRSRRAHEHECTDQRELFVRLSQNTLALRRMLCTKISAFLHNKALVCLAGIDVGEASAFLLDNMAYFTEKEQLVYKLTYLGLQQDAGQIQLVTQELEAFFARQAGAFSDVRSFCEHFSICVDPRTGKLLVDDAVVDARQIHHKRHFKFKLEEALRMFAYLQDQHLVLSACRDAFCIVAELAAAHQEFIPQNFVYQNDTHKVNLCSGSGINSQFFQIDVDEPQQYITRFNYDLEWLDEVFDRLAEVLIQNGWR